MTDFTSADLTGSRFSTCTSPAAVPRRGPHQRPFRPGRPDRRGDPRGGSGGHGPRRPHPGNLRINGVDVVPLVEAELNRRYPDRSKMRPADADGFRDAWASLERLWPQTVERARTVHPEQLHERGRRRVVVHRDVAPPRLRHRCLGTAGGAGQAVTLRRAGPAARRDGRHSRCATRYSTPSRRWTRCSSCARDRMSTVRQVLAELTDEKLATRVAVVAVVSSPAIPSRRATPCAVPAGHPDRRVGAPPLRRARFRPAPAQLVLMPGVLRDAMNAAAGRGQPGADLISLGDAESRRSCRVPAATERPAWAGIAGRIVGAGEPVVGAGLLVPVAYLAGQVQRSCVLGAGVARQPDGKQQIAQAVVCLGLGGPGRRSPDVARAPADGGRRPAGNGLAAVRSHRACRGRRPRCAGCRSRGILRETA